MSDAPTYSLKELANATGITTHQIRHWMRRQMLPLATPRGPNTRYDDEHRLWINAILRTMARGMSMRDAAKHVRSLDSFEAIAAAAGEPVPVPPQPAPAAPAPPPPPPTAPLAAEPVVSATSPSERAFWERIPLCTGVELHVSVGADVQALQIARAIEAAFGKSKSTGSR